MTKSKKRVTRAERNIAWIEEHCRVPEGKDVGKPVVLRPWQQKELKRIYDNPHGTRRAILSFGRKNGKTALSAFLLLLHLVGPEARANSQLYSAAQSREQAGILFALSAKIVRLSPTLSPFITVRDTKKELLCPEIGSLYRALSAEASTAYGLSPVFVVHDEAGQIQGDRSELYEALETAVGAQESPLSIIISTQAPTDADLLSILIDDALEANDPRVVLSLHTADPDLDPFSLKAIKQANPALGDFLNKTEVMAMASDAKRMPSREASFRNLILNQRVEASSPFVSRSVWQSCIGDVLTDFKGLPVFAGLDLSEVQDLTALVLIAFKDGIWHVRPTFWLPEEGIFEKSRTDRVPYDQWSKQGHLNLIPGRSIEYDYVASYLRNLADQIDIRRIAFDRWNWRHFRPALIRAGFTEEEIDGEDDDEGLFVSFGQGFQSMSPALRTLESALLNQKIVHGDHPVLNFCAANAVVQSDPAGNRKLTKQKSRGRIDGMVALTMAMGVAGSFEEEVETLSVYELLARERMECERLNTGNVQLH